MKAILIFVIIFLLAIVAIVVGSQNTQIISVNYLIAKTDMQVSTFLVISLAIGFTVGVLLMLSKYLSLRVQNTLLLRRIKKISKEAN